MPSAAAAALGGGRHLAPRLGENVGHLGGRMLVGERGQVALQKHEAGAILQRLHVAVRCGAGQPFLAQQRRHGGNRGAVETRLPHQRGGALGVVGAQGGAPAQVPGPSRREPVARNRPPLQVLRPCRDTQRRRGLGPQPLQPRAHAPRVEQLLGVLGAACVLGMRILAVCLVDPGKYVLQPRRRRHRTKPIRQRRRLNTPHACHRSAKARPEQRPLRPAPVASAAVRHYCRAQVSAKLHGTAFELE